MTNHATVTETMSLTANAKMPRPGAVLSRCVLLTLALICLGATAHAPSAHATFGIQSGSFVADAYKSDNVTPETQAGATPYQATAAFAFNRDPASPGGNSPDEGVKDIRVDLPTGLIGNPQAVPTCSRGVFNRSATQNAALAPLCPPATQVGVVKVTLNSFGGSGDFVTDTPVYNIEPRENEVASFGFIVATAPIYVSASVRTEGDFGVRISLPNISQLYEIRASSLTFWGVPADPSHDAQRGVVCTTSFGFSSCSGANGGAGIASPAPLTVFLRNPTFCGPPVTTALTVDSWQHPGSLDDPSDPNVKRYGATTASGPTRCDKPAFKPSISVTPDSTELDSPTGLSVDLNVPQNNDPNGLATPHLRDAVVRLPDGMTVSASAADGLDGCSDTQIRLHSDAEPTCPPASKIGDIAVDTPLLADPLAGSIYLGTQTKSQLLRLFLVLKGRGLLIKIPGKVDPDAVTGQLTATFENNPQLPFSRFHLHFKGGPRAPLATPATCGTMTATSSLTSWASDIPATPSDAFKIDCRGTTGFSPTFRAGTGNPAGGAFSEFTLRFGRQDGEQLLGSIDATLPPGLLATVADVSLCAEEQIRLETCPEASKIGTTQVAAGVGSSPLWVPQADKPGTAVYLTGPYKGAPLGLAIVVPAQAGPFDLGTVTVRAALFVDPHDAHISVKSDPLPTILEGIPLRVREVQVSIDRPKFMFNPTNCDAMKIAATISSTAGAKADVSSRFQVGDCARLPFNPTFASSTSGKATRKQGASLKVHIGQLPDEAHIRSVAVTLPRKLPARLVPTLNGACPMEVERDQGHLACPETSKVGWAVAKTPILDGTVEGPAYIVAKGDNLPKLSIYLEAKEYPGVKLQLDGDIDINPKTNLTKTTFATVPDVPITSFDLDLPKGSHSALAAPGNDLCQGTMKMITTIIAQSGTRIDRKEPVAVSGCGTSVASKTVGASSVRLALEHVGPGVVTAWGSHLRTAKRTITNGTTGAITVPLSPEGRRSLARRGKLTVKVLVSYAPASGQPQSSTKSRHATTTVTFTRTKAR
jgi:hypothetical protein